MSVTLPYLPLVFRHLNSLPIFILNLNKYNLLPNVVSKKAGRVANSVEPDETPHFASHLGLHCSGMSDQIHTVKYNVSYW